jgi:hypothetical protein
MSFDRTGNVTLENPADVVPEDPAYSIPGTPGAASVTTIVASGLASLNGGIAVDSTAFTVADTSGNTAIAGTLAVTGATTLTGALTANGGITCDTDKFTVADTSGNTAIGGTLAVTGATTLTGALTANGGITCDTDKFTVADTSGNTAIGGTLAVTGASTLTGAVTAAEAGGNVTAKGFKISDGGTVTQATNITTGVTLSKTTGQITTVTAPSIAAAAEATFTVTNTLVAATSIVLVAVADQFDDGLVVATVSAIGSGTFDITLTNLSAAAVSAGSAVINFAVFEGSAT